MQAFIDDGYSRTVGLRERPGIHPAVEFTYRPYCGNEASALKSRLLLGDATAGEDFKQDLASRIEKWSFNRPITVENLNKLNAKVFEGIANILLGYQAADYEIEPDGQENAEPLADADQEDADLKN